MNSIVTHLVSDGVAEDEAKMNLLFSTRFNPEARRHQRQPLPARASTAMKTN
jgi:hypothetical protein